MSISSIRVFPVLVLGVLVLGENSARSEVTIRKRPDGYNVQTGVYKAHLAPQGWLDRFDVARLTPIRGIALGEMGKKGPVNAQQTDDGVTFDELQIYHVVYQFREDGFRVSVTTTEKAAARDGTDGKWGYLFFRVFFGPEAQLAKILEPPGDVIFPARTSKQADHFVVTMSDGTKIEVVESGDNSFPNDPGGIGGQGPSAYSWQRGSMKPGKEYQYNFTVTPGEKGQTVLAAPPVTIQCNLPERRTTSDGSIAFLARVVGEDVLRLGKQAKSLRVNWKVVDFFGKTVFEQALPLKTAENQADLVSTIAAPVERAGWFRVEATLDDRGGRMLSNRAESDYAVVVPGILPDIPSGNKDLGPSINPELNAWVGFGLERISGWANSSVLPQVAASGRRTGLHHFFLFGSVPPDAAAPDQFGQRVGQVVDKYKSDCKHWEIINEPQADQPMSPEKYVEYLKAATAAAKAVDPDCKILGPTVCGIDLGYIEAVYKLGGGKCFDILTVHPYTGHWRGWVEQGVEVQYRALRELMARYGDEKKEVWFTESGFQHTFWITPIPEVQSRFVVQEFLLCDSWGLSKDKVSYFFLKDHGFEKWYVVRGDNSLSPAAVAMRNYAQQVRGLTFAETLDVGRNRKAMHYRGGNRQVVALFSYDFPAKAVLATDAEKAFVVDFFGNRKPAIIADGKLTVTVSGYPTYVLLPPKATVRGVPEDMGENLALHAACTVASGQASAGEATDGITTASGNHAGLPGWTSDKDAPLPQWLEVTLPKPSAISRVIVYTNSAFCGPAGIRDYEIQIREKDAWRTVGKEVGNVDRWVLEHRFQPVTTDRVRILVTKLNNGGLRDDPRKYADLVVRVAEIEVYAR